MRGTWSIVGGGPHGKHGEECGEYAGAKTGLLEDSQQGHEGLSSTTVENESLNEIRSGIVPRTSRKEHSYAETWNSALREMLSRVHKPEWSSLLTYWFNKMIDWNTFCKGPVDE